MWSPASDEEKFRVLDYKYNKLKEQSEAIWFFLKSSPDFLARLRQPARNDTELLEKTRCIEFYATMEDAAPISTAGMERQDIENYSQFVYRNLMNIK